MEQNTFQVKGVCFPYSTEVGGEDFSRRGKSYFQTWPGGAVAGAQMG